jgi:hypothetical protein
VHNGCVHPHDSGKGPDPGGYAPYYGAPDGGGGTRETPPARPLPTFEHPLFPDVELKREPVYVGFRRKGTDGTLLDYPGEVAAADIVSWGQVVDWWGGGEYQAAARDKNHRMIAWFPSEGFKRFDGDPKPFVKPGSRSAQPAAPAQPATSSSAGEVYTKRDLEIATLRAKLDAKESHGGERGAEGGGYLQVMIEQIKAGALVKAAEAKARAEEAKAASARAEADAGAAATRAEAEARAAREAADRRSEADREMFKILLSQKQDPVAQFTALMGLVKANAPAPPPAPAPDPFEVAEKAKKLFGGQSGDGGEIRAFTDFGGTLVHALTNT